MWNSLRIQLTVIFITLAIAPLIVVGAILAQRTYSSERDLAMALQNQVSQNVSSSVNSYFQGVVSDMNSLGDEIRNLKQADRSQFLSIMLSALSTGPRQNDYQELTLLNAQGQEEIRVSHQSITPIDQLQDQSGSDEYKTPIATHGAYFSAVSFDKTSGIPFITISIPLYQPRSVQLYGVLVAKLNFVAVSDLIAQVPAGEGETVYITDSSGQLLAHQDHSFNLQKSHITLPKQTSFQSGVSNTNVVLGVKSIQLGGQTLDVVAEKPVSDALSLAFVLIGTLIVTAIATLIVAGGLGFLAVRQIVLPIEHLAATAKQITEGDLSQQSNVNRKDEIGMLSVSFNSMTRRLRDTLQGLEERVNDRTSQLQAANRKNELRAAQFEALTLVSQAINSIRSIEELLPRITTVISEQFGYYHIGIFLNDESNETAFLTAANSEGGQRMLARGHNLKIGEQGIVGHVAGSGVARIAHKVGEDASFFNNPDLPETRAEMAMPLRSANKVVGVLDVQSTLENAFSKEDIRVLELLADQVSLAIDNTRLYETTRRALDEAEALYRQYLKQAWSRLPREQRMTGYRYNQRGSTQLEIPITLDVHETKVQQNDSEAGARINVPIKLRGETIGNLIVHVPQDKEWEQDQIELIEAVAERVALSAENARLFDETSRRAERERMVTEITSKIRSTNDPEVMIRTALDELRNALGATQVQLIPQVVAVPEKDQNEIISSSSQDSTAKGQPGNGARK